MKESYREGVANHPGPESCEGGRKAALEALDRGICRLGIELRNRVVQGADGVRQPEGNNVTRDSASAARPCGVEDPRHAEKLHAREPGDPVVAREQSAGRRENAMSDKSFMHGGGESYSGIVPAKQPNKSEPSPAEVCGGKAADQGEHAASPTRAGHRAGKAGQAGWSVCAKQRSRMGS